MFLTIGDVLDSAAIADIAERAAGLRWRDGVATAGSAARQVKRNLQADLSSREGARLRTDLEEAIWRHPVLRAAAQPRRFSKLLLSRTLEGGGYGLHVDNAIMGDGEAALRTDLSFTLFLSGPESYGGGELVVESAGSTHSFKPEAGTLLLYPSTSLHRVADVTSGERLVCVGWIESRIRDSAAREILFDLLNLRASLSESHDAQSPELLILQKAISNLMRLWT